MSNKIEYIELKDYYSELVCKLVEFNNKLYNYLKERNELDLFERVIIQNRELEMIFGVGAGYVLTETNSKIEYHIFTSKDVQLYKLYNLYEMLQKNYFNFEYSLTSITIKIE